MVTFSHNKKIWLHFLNIQIILVEISVQMVINLSMSDHITLIIITGLSIELINQD